LVQVRERAHLRDRQRFANRARGKGRSVNSQGPFGIQGSVSWFPPRILRRAVQTANSSTSCPWAPLHSLPRVLSSQLPTRAEACPRGATPAGDDTRVGVSDQFLHVGR
jgi:hypothetical protein